MRPSPPYLQLFWPVQTQDIKFTSHSLTTYYLLLTNVHFCLDLRILHSSVPFGAPQLTLPTFFPSQHNKWVFLFSIAAIWMYWEERERRRVDLGFFKARTGLWLRYTVDTSHLSGGPQTHHWMFNWRKLQGWSLEYCRSEYLIATTHPNT